MKTTLLSFIALTGLVLLVPACASSDSSTARSASVKPYTLNTCIVTDNELGSMGEVVTKTYGDQQVKFCCKPCVKKFEANPAKYLAKLPR